MLYIKIPFKYLSIIMYYLNNSYLFNIVSILIKKE